MAASLDLAQDEAEIRKRQRESRRRRRAAKALRLHSTYEQRVAEMRQAESAFFKEAERIAGIVEEPNVLSIYRLVELFGPELIADKAAEAWTLFQEAKNRGKEAYVKSEDGTAVATRKGQPRTPGGVFFFLMRQHSDSLGLRWAGLDLPELPKNPVAHLRPGYTPKPAAEASPNGEQPAAGSQSVTKVESPAEPKAITTAAPPKPANVNKPTRSTIAITGRLARRPKVEPNGKTGLVELEFEVEMSQSLPKGLPNLGKTRAVVWCSKKQYDKMKDSIKPQTRLRVEGEPGAGYSIVDEKAFLRVICLKLINLDAEQAARAALEEM
jgi:hypothetical protein